MDWLKKLLGCKEEELQADLGLCEGRENSYIERLRKYDALFYNLDKSAAEQANKIINLEQENTELRTDLGNKETEFNNMLKQKDQTIESLKTSLAMQGEIVTKCPVWLNQNKQAYHPWIQIPKTDEGYSMQNPRYIYTQSTYLNDSIDAMNNRKLSKYEKLIKAWYFAIDSLTYMSDQPDNWQTHTTTMIRKKGDCEDGTILAIDTFRALGVAADETFNAVGPTNFGYHSYPIAYLSADDVVGTPLDGQGDAWYIYESTLDYHPSKPLKLVGSVYWVDNVANWKYAGEIDKYNYGALFNGSMPSAGELPTKIQDSKQKRKSINKYWKEMVK